MTQSPTHDKQTARPSPTGNNNWMLPKKPTSSVPIRSLSWLKLLLQTRALINLRPANQRNHQRWLPRRLQPQNQQFPLQCSQRRLPPRLQPRVQLNLQPTNRRHHHRWPSPPLQLRNRRFLQPCPYLRNLRCLPPRSQAKALPNLRPAVWRNHQRGGSHIVPNHETIAFSFQGPW